MNPLNSTASWRENVSQRLMRFLAFSFLICLYTSAVAQIPHVFVPNGEQKQSLVGYMEYLDDPEGTYTIDQVANERASEFKPLLSSKRLGYAYDNKALWVRFTIDFKQYAEPHWFLTYDNEHIGKLTLYWPSNNGFLSKHLEEFTSYEGRAFLIREYLFKLPTPKTRETTYYIRLDSQGHFLRAGMSWAGVQGVVESIHHAELAFGLFFGALVVMWFYNAALYVSLRDRAYLYYIYYLGCFIAVFFYIFGFAPLVLQLTPRYEQFFAACGYGAIHGMVIFARHFLALKHSIKWFDRYLQFFQWVLALGAIAAFFQPVAQPFNALNYLILLVLPVLVLSGLVRWYQGYEPARIYSFGWVVFAASLGLLSLRSVGLLPSNLITNYAIQIGSVWESFLFAVALAYRIKLIERDKKVELEAERAQLEVRVAERTQALQTSLEARRLMVANASHELRTPVNALRLLLDSFPKEANGTVVLPRVQEITDHMSQLVETLLLLDPDRPPNHNPGLIETFDFGSEIRSTAHLVVPLQHGSLASFDVDVEQCLGVVVRGDRSALRRILINLLSNAFKFTQEGRVSLTAKVEGNRNPGDTITCAIRVADSGLGIDPKMQEQIFAPFVTSGLKDGHVGTGLGLAISRQLAQNLGGSLELIKSAPRQGSIFECVVPFFLSEPSRILEAAFKPNASCIETSQVAAKPRFKVLLAEDDPITAEAVQLIIGRLNHEVVHVATYGELCRALKENIPPFDIALTDHRLPGGNGLDAIKICRANGIATTTRMVLLTADATDEVLAIARQICDDVVTKPTTALRIRQLLGDSRAKQPTREIASIEYKVLDPNPLIALRHCGATHTTLSRLCNVFYTTIGDRLSQIKMALTTATDSTSAESLEAILHRVRSSCATIGAVALAREFQLLAAGIDSSMHDEQLSQVMRTLEITREALTTLLVEIGTNEQRPA